MQVVSIRENRKMFDFIASGQGRSLINHAARRDEDSRAVAMNAAGAPRCITVDATDLTCGDHVLELFNLCRRAFREGGRHVVIDLHSVTRADTKIIACLIALYQLARSASVRLEVCLSQAVVEIAGVCRLDSFLRELMQKPTNAIAGADATA